MIRGDGNCYYRAFLYAICEALLVRNKGIRNNNDNHMDNDDHGLDSELQRLQQYGAFRIYIPL